MALRRKWAVQLAPSTDTQRAATLVRCRMALEHPSAFLIAACDDDALSGYVCVPSGRGVHRLDAVVWADSNAPQPALRLRELRRWHADAYPDACLTPGTLGAEELWAWGQSEE